MPTKCFAYDAADAAVPADVYVTFGTELLLLLELDELLLLEELFLFAAAAAAAAADVKTSGEVPFVEIGGNVDSGLDERPDDDIFADLPRRSAAEFADAEDRLTASASERREARRMAAEAEKAAAEAEAALKAAEEAEAAAKAAEEAEAAAKAAEEALREAEAAAAEAADKAGK